ncbi:hypothetical protein CANARDRAFT_27557 [[Candida] arabinofermentans NRRL YB-2248]|uniref:Uncharacterized protein n=1 Tax=[Candida] arabinofermentans NRRL YB-2248 TaxID=983967 RepID=A0A1E4T3J4_9ASCO|nr:hypothetical protein CANARDRAFT_27557 [[Candida] arabinofermentans NRRL YB-2248]
MINGYDQFIQSLKAKNNRDYVAKVMQEMNGTTNSNSQTSRKNKQQQQKKKNDEFQKYSLEEFMNKTTELEIFHDIHIFPIKGLNELVEWLKSFSYTITTKHVDPLERNSDLSTISSIKSGTDNKDSYLKSLQQFKYVIENVAKKIYGLAPTFGNLYDKLNSYDELKDNNGGRLVRSDVESGLRKVLLSDDCNELLDE